MANGGRRVEVLEQVPGLGHVPGSAQGTETVHLDRHVDHVAGETSECAQLAQCLFPLRGVIGGQPEHLSDRRRARSQALGLSQLGRGSGVALIGELVQCLGQMVQSGIAAVLGSRAEDLLPNPFRKLPELTDVTVRCSRRWPVSWVSRLRLSPLLRWCRSGRLLNVPSPWVKNEGPPTLVGSPSTIMPGGDLLSQGLPPSTIGAGGFHFRVRNGNGWFPAAVATGQSFEFSATRGLHSDTNIEDSFQALGLLVPVR